MTRNVFAALDVYRDDASRAAAMNMAIDEALLEVATAPSIRFYRWDHPALSFGYFGKFSDVANLASERDLVRRWTGGGIVLHGDDLTYSIVIPANDSLFAESSRSIYAAVHEAIRNALVADGKGAELASVSAVCDRRNQIDPAAIDRRYNKNACFANAVRADVLVNGQKVAGAAQRRTRRGLLQQGSIQHVDLAEDFPERFARELSAKQVGQEVNGSILDRAREIAANRYGTTAWLQRR
jgi:lipoate-protein ligase A